MKQTTKYSLAGLLSAAGTVLQAFANELLGTDSPVNISSAIPEDPVAPAEPPTNKRGRKPAVEKPVTPTPEPEPQPEPTPTPAEEPKEEGESAEAKEARYQRNRGLIEPLVKGVKKEGSETEYAIQPQGQAVRAIIKKYSPTEKLPDLPLDKQADFEGDIEALTM